jgi:superfamily II DNA or RNA helicase
MDHLGAKFGLVVFDEVHHLPSEAYKHAAIACLAPFRLGLTATPERTDGREAVLDDLVGPVVYRKDIVDIRGEFLADYEIERRFFDLTPEERVAYDEERALYIGFLRAQGISLAAPDGWGRFLAESSRTKEGRRAFLAFRTQRALAFAASEKFAFLEELFTNHASDRTLLFTQDNATAYRISEHFLVPVITHRTRPSERIAILRGLSEGTYNAIVTSRVLNEGVDVPDANVAVIVSGSGSVREHVQRLGRILRKKDGKHALLYELVTSETSEAKTSDRRREHSAYR